MEKLTADQALEMAVSFRDLATRVGDYVLDNWNELTPAQRSKLDGLEWSIRNYSTDFVALGLKLTMDDLDVTVKKINNATNKMKKAIQTIKEIKKIINIAAAAVTLGGAIISENPGAILDALTGIADAIAA